MAKYISIAAVAFIAGACWWSVGGPLSSEMIAMALGILFGLLAGLPVVLLLMASNRQVDRRGYEPLQKLQRKPAIAPLVCENCGQPFKLINGEYRHHCATIDSGVTWRVVETEVNHAQ